MQIASPFPVPHENFDEEQQAKYEWFALYLIVYKKGSDWKTCVLREQSWSNRDDHMIVGYDNTRYDDLLEASFAGLEKAKEKFDTDEHVDTNIKRHNESNGS